MNPGSQVTQLIPGVLRKSGSEAGAGEMEIEASELEKNKKIGNLAS